MLDILRLNYRDSNINWDSKSSKESISKNQEINTFLSKNISFKWTYGLLNNDHIYATLSKLHPSITGFTMSSFKPIGQF